MSRPRTSVFFDPVKGLYHYPENVKRKRQRMRELILKAKDRPCADCGGVFPPCVMDFDHRSVHDKHLKLRRPSPSGSRHTIAQLGYLQAITEIAKCDVVCANCHRIRSHAQREAGVFVPGRKIGAA